MAPDDWIECAECHRRLQWHRFRVKGTDITVGAADCLECMVTYRDAPCTPHTGPFKLVEHPVG